MAVILKVPFRCNFNKNRTQRPGPHDVLQKRACEAKEQTSRNRHKAMHFALILDTGPCGKLNVTKTLTRNSPDTSSACMKCEQYEDTENQDASRCAPEKLSPGTIEEGVPGRGMGMGIVPLGQRNALLGNNSLRKEGSTQWKG